MCSQTTASPFMAPFLLHIQITTVLGIPPASHNAMATRRIMCNWESFNFLPWLSSAASPAAQQRTWGPAQSGAGLPATTAGIALSHAGRHWKQPVTPPWGSLDPSSPPALISTGIFPISTLGVTLALHLQEEPSSQSNMNFTSLYHWEKVKSQLKSLDSQEVTLSSACYPQAKATNSIPDQGSILGMTTSSALPGRDGGEMSWDLSPDLHTETICP